METKVNQRDDARPSRRAATELKAALRELRVQLSLLNHHIGTKADLNDVDLDCLDLISAAGEINPSALAKRAGLHRATMTGILDRMERGGWIVRDRDAHDRRAIVIRAVPERNRDMFRLYSGMNSLLDEICDGYDAAQIDTITDFLRRSTDAGFLATEQFTSES